MAFFFLRISIRDADSLNMQALSSSLLFLRRKEQTV